METLIKEIGRIADSEGLEAFVVGGYVRDRLLKKPVKDFDVMVVGDGISFAEKVAAHFQIKTLVVYHNFGTAMLPMGESHDYQKIEFVGARRESYHAESRNPAVEPADLRSDLSRRDFTINALAMQINEKNYGVIIDLFNGKKDLDDSILRTPLNPDETFSDDPLRMMRAIRFASQLQFKIEEKTFQGIIKNASRISIISQERITDEFLKMLAGPKPSVGLQLLNDTGLLQHILPELASLNGVEQQQGFLHKDVFKHTLKVVDNISEMTEDIRLRFAALLHDIAKPRTKKFVEGIGWTFYGHEEVGSRMVKGIGKKFKLPNDFYLYVSKIVKLHMRPIQLVDEGVTDSAIRRLIFDGGENIDELLTLCRADITSGNKERAKKHLANFEHVLQRVREVEEKDRLRAFQPPIRGDEIMALFDLAPGKKVGMLKKMIEEAILDGIIPNEYQAAYDYLMQHKDEILSSDKMPGVKN
ncbi:HD domain-containing protein [bacterium]|nr:HD domain-containing protein [bacterium]